MTAPLHTAASRDAVLAPPPILAIRRRTIDKLLVSLGAVAAVVLCTAGGLLTWGTTFADDYVGRELSSQHVFFPDATSLSEEGRTDLLGYAGEQVTTGTEAEAYASYIDGHLDGIADGKTYADLGTVETQAKAAVVAAKADGSSEAHIASLQAEADAVAAQRNTLFKGETLRGLLLSTYAWSTIGTIAFIASLVAFLTAAVMTVLVVLGVVHLRRQPAR